MKKKFKLSQLILSIFMIGITLTMVIPLLNVVARSFSDPALSPQMTGLEILPRGFSLVNYKVVFGHPVLMRSFMNSLFITFVGTAINIVLTTTAAYVLTRPNLVFKKLFMGFLICMMLFDPGLVPEYLVVQKIGLMGSQWSVILAAAVNVFYLIILMRFFSDIPASIYEAAIIDGTGHITMLTKIVCPLAKPGIATITMFYAVARWNEYFKSGIYISSQQNTVLQVILRKFVVSNETRTIVGAQNLMNYNSVAQLDYTALKSATIVIAIIPILCIYPLVLKYYTKGIMTGGVKE